MSQPSTATTGAAVALVTLLVGAAHAASEVFVQDDAFISFRYAANLVAGHGLVYNPGEYVEGYTNFLWTLLLAGAMALGLDPVDAAATLSMGAWLGALVASFVFVGRFVQRHPTDSPLPWLLLTPLALNPSWAAYATGGLETALFAALAVVGTGLTLLGDTRGHRVGGGIALTLLCLTRPDGLLLATGCLAFTAWRGRREALELAAPLLLVLPAYGAWKLWFYGDLLPNTYYAKAAWDPYPERGLVYLAHYYGSYATLLLAALALPVAAILARGPVAPLLALWALVAAFNGYVAWVGGGFMEYKAILHVFPLTLCLGACSLALLSGRVHRQLLLAVVAVALGLALAARKPSRPHRTLSIVNLRGQVGPWFQWARVGAVLKERLPADTRISVAAAGAIPYYSGLYNLDPLGLTEATIARRRLTERGVPGHERWADGTYLVDHGIHLRFAGADTYRTGDLPDRPVGPRDRELFVWLWSDRWLRTVYLTPHPELDARIDAHPDRYHLVQTTERRRRRRARRARRRQLED